MRLSALVPESVPESSQGLWTRAVPVHVAGTAGALETCSEAIIGAADLFAATWAVLSSIEGGGG